MSENNLSLPAKLAVGAAVGAGLTPDHMGPGANILAGATVAAGVHLGQKIKSGIEARRGAASNRKSEFHDSYKKHGQVSFNEAANWDKDF
jgi:hypothetical protein